MKIVSAKFWSEDLELTRPYSIAYETIEAVENIPNPSIYVKLNEIEQNVSISVKDNGIGIDENKVTKLFEPYFTTKDKGTGLGLSIVKKIIEDHGGIIKIEKNKNMAGSKIMINFEIN